MKILSLNGSHRADRGYTGFLLDKIQQGATSAGAEFESIPLAKLNIRRCSGCSHCQQPEHLLQCVHQERDDAKSVFDKMAAADLLVFATPVYVLGMSSALRQFLERLYGTANCADLRLTRSGLLFHHIQPELCSKPFAAVIVCDNLEQETPANVVAWFRTYARFSDAAQVGTLVRNAGLLTGRGRDPKREQEYPRVRDAHRAFVQAGVELATAGRVSRETERRASQPVLSVPFIQWIMRFSFLKPKVLEQARARMAAREKTGSKGTTEAPE